jgi:photosystem II stability/assembly factor-like uncharacterized protein
MKLLVSILALTIFSASSFSQSITGWQPIYPYPHGENLKYLYAFNTRRIIVIGDRGIVMQTRDGGERWDIQKYAGGAMQVFRSLSFGDSLNGMMAGRSPGTIMRTSDGGKNWNLLFSDATKIFTTIVYLNKNVALACGQKSAPEPDADYVIRTTDGGTTWTDIPSPLHRYVLDMTFADSSVGLASGQYGIMRSTDGGLSWTLVLDLLGNNPGSQLWQVGHCQFTDSTTVIGLGQVGSRQVFLRSSNAGETWDTTHYSGIPVTNGFDFLDANRALMCGGSSIIQTTDGGATWSTFTLENANFQKVKFLDSNTALAIGDGGLICKTTDGGASWSQIAGTTSICYSIAFNSALLGTAVGSKGAVLHTEDGGLHWEKQSSGTTNNLARVFLHSSTVATAIGSKGTIVRTTDGGATWVGQSSGTTKDLREGYFLDSLTGIVVGGPGKILRTTDGGTTWTDRSIDSSVYYRSVWLCNKQIGIVVAVRYQGDLGASQILIYRTTDGGVTWADQTAGIGGANNPTLWYSSGLTEVFFIDSSAGFAIGNGKIFTSGDPMSPIILKTTDGGLTWANQPNGAEASLYNIQFLDADRGFLLVSSGDIFYTSDGGAHWNNQHTPLEGATNITFVPYETGWIGFGTTQFGTIASMVISPIPPRSWTGAVDSSWNNPYNWSPANIPTLGDSVIIPSTLIHPVICEPQQQITVAGVTILSGGQLTLTDSLARFVVLGDVVIEGTLEISAGARTSIVVGRNWDSRAGGLLKSYVVRSNGGFNHGESTVIFTGTGKVRGNFYNLLFDTTSTKESMGNIRVADKCTNVMQLTLRESDTLFIDNPAPQALVGSGTIRQGTIKRLIDTHATEPYQFESEETYIRFENTGTAPTSVAMTVNADTNSSFEMSEWEVVPSWVDTTANRLVGDSITHFSKWRLGVPRPSTSNTQFVNRSYTITPHGGSEYQAQVSLRYAQSEVPPGLSEDSLVMLREASVERTLQTQSGWDMVSLPVRVSDARTTVLFPSAISAAFTYETFYTREDTLEMGVGYWLKYREAEVINFLGQVCLTESVTVHPGWNMIGSISEPIPASSITSEPPNLHTSDVFGYQQHYLPADTIYPAKGYWIKTSESGKLVLSTKQAYSSASTNRIKIVPTSELPPLPPDVDAFEQAVPKAYALEQNYPNPFNPVTTLKYELPVDSKVSLRIYNVLGQVAAVLADDVQQAGYKSVEWDARGAASGVYFYRLNATSTVGPRRTFTNVKKMCLVK